MSTATSLVYLQYGSTRKGIQNKGKDWVRGTAVMPSGNNNVSITNIPNLSPGSIVRVIQQANGGNTAKMGYQKNLKLLKQNNQP